MSEARVPQLTVPLTTFSASGRDSWLSMFEQARALDAGGADRLVVSDHVVFGEDLEEYGRPEIGGQAGGRQPTGPDGHWLEPMTTLSVLAGMTERIRLGTNILLAAIRRPVVLAKSASTLDVLSGGRLDLGVGVGWQRAEYHAAGLTFDDRGRALDETLEICQLLWREQTASYSSPATSFSDIHMMPKPLQFGGVPLWISGTVNSRVVRRLARFGAGWIPWGPDAADPDAGIARMRAALEDVGYDWSQLQVSGNLSAVRDGDGELDLGATMAVVPALVGAGVTDFRFAFRPLPRFDEAVDQVRDVVSAFRLAAADH